MSDTVRRCLAVVAAIVAAYFLLHVLRFVALTGEVRGGCAGIVAYVVGERIARGAPPRRRRRRP